MNTGLISIQLPVALSTEKNLSGYQMNLFIEALGRALAQETDPAIE
jgi:hypothetical protein